MNKSLDHRVKIKESEKINKYLDLARELKMENKGDSNTNSSWCTWNSPKRIRKGIETVENWRKNWDYSDYSIIEIEQKT